MYGKFEITGEIEVLTGMHIGGSTEFAAIGAVDAPVMRDKLENLPFIPGSSLKGKIRYLLQEKYGDKTANSKITHSDDTDFVCRLFGSSKADENKKIRKSRLKFSDSYITNLKELENKGIDGVTEVKFENTIHRFTAVATPRQIERVIRGTKFDLNIIYTVENEEEILEDIKFLKEGLELLQYDYIGGSGSRGYGRVKINDLEMKLVIGDINSEIIEEGNKILGEK